MDKQKATKILVKELIEREYLHRYDSGTFSYYADKAISAIPLQQKIEEIHSCEAGWFSSTKEKELKFMKEVGANYLFINPIGYNSVDCYKELTTPFAIIGEQEVKLLNATFYKEIPQKISEAMKTLKIESFEEPFKTYKTYQDNMGNFEKIGVGDVIQGSQTGMYYKVNNITKSTYYGPQYYDKELTRLSNSQGYCEFPYAELIRKSPLHSLEFCNFVFTLPLEEQNIEANNKILELFAEKLDYEKILSQTYQNNPNQFKEYFEILKKGTQQEVVDSVKTLKKNIELDSWLFSEGFDISLEHLTLYNTNQEMFKKYFGKSSEETKKVILWDIYQLKDEQTNPEINKWLSQNYPKLVETIGRDRIEQKIEEDKKVR